MKTKTLEIPEGAFTLSVKGFLAVETGHFSDIDRIWRNLENFVARQAAKNGMTDGVPCLVFADGGHCITVKLADG